ncbi:MAG: MBL fold metallo-hydrolase [Treponema sp.]|nr:MBL fold metallo-hydrolase [Treponema sp.]
MLTARFWGVRGSIPCPGPDTVVYGGNTSCLEIRADERLLIIDLGSGVRPLGNFLIENDLKKYGKINADILLTHTHWDHIMGFPVFAPIYTPGTELRITAPVINENDDIKSIIENQLSYQYWPVRAEELPASIKYSQIKETTLDLGGGLVITSKLLNHANSCMGYRICYKGNSIVTIYDHEPFHSLYTVSPEDAGYNKEEARKAGITAAEENEKIRQFIKGADIVIHDAQYSQVEYLSHIGWGHCSYEHTVEAATGIDVKKLVLFHHDPSHTDKFLKQVGKKYSKNKKPKIIIAKEGLVLNSD